MAMGAEGGVEGAMAGLDIKEQVWVVVMMS